MLFTRNCTDCFRILSTFQFNLQLLFFVFLYVGTGSSKVNGAKMTLTSRKGSQGEAAAMVILRGRIHALETENNELKEKIQVGNQFPC